MIFSHDCLDVNGRKYQLEVDFSPEFRLISVKAEIPETGLYRLKRAISAGIELPELIQLFEKVSISYHHIYT
jgi:hypothetical protein